MRQVWLESFGEPEVLRLREGRDPEPGPGEVRIRVGAVGVNFADVVARVGIYPDLPKPPMVPGYEAAGTVDALGAGVDAAWQGAPVVALTPGGGYCDVLCAPVGQVFRRPDGMTDEEGAAFPVNYLTAWVCMVVMGSLARGQTVLVHGAGGGVGLAAVQLAHRIEARVLGTASTRKHDTLRAMGVEDCIDPAREDVPGWVRAVTGGRGVDLALDSRGGGSIGESYDCLAPTGRLALFGVSSAIRGKTRGTLGLIRMLLRVPWFRFNPVSLMNANKGVFGVNLARLWDEGDRVAGWMEGVFEGYRDGSLKPVIAATFPLAEAPKAHHYLQDRKNVGKVLLIP